MSYELYQKIQLIASTLTLFLSTLLIFRKVPQKLHNTLYLKSRKIMGCALAITPIFSILYYCTNLNKLPEYYATAINLTAYYPTAALVHIALLALIEKDINLHSRKFKLYSTTFVIYPLFIFFGVGHLEIDKTLTIANTLLFSSIASHFIYFYTHYKLAKKHNEEQNNQEIKTHLKWIKTSFFLLVGLAVIACLAPAFFSYSRWIGLFYMSYNLVIIMYIYESYHKFLITYNTFSPKKDIPTISNIEAEEEEVPKTTLNQDQYKILQRKVNTWINKKQFKRGGLTMLSVAEELQSNRTYLSSYINSTYNCSFKVWLTGHRLEEAKKLLIDHPNLSISEVAQQAGFSSQSSFIHVFRNTIGSTPAKWRSLNKNSEE